MKSALRWLIHPITPSEWRFAAIFRLDRAILLGWFVIFAVYAMQPLSDPDTPWHLATGQYILTHHFVPTTDPFSWSMKGQPWVTQEWLFETVLAWLVAKLQFIGAWVLYVGLQALTVVLLYRLGLRSSGGHRLLAAVLAVVGILGGMEFWTLRPQIASYALFTLFLLIIQQVREGRYGLLWCSPFFLWLWANTHGSATIGAAVLIFEVILSWVPSVGRFRRVPLPQGASWRLLLAAAIGVGLGFINPNGSKAFTYALLGTNQLMVNNIMEWHSPDFHTQFFKYGIIPALLIVLVILIGRSRISIPWRELIFFGGSLAMTLIYQRFMPYLAIAAVPLLAAVLGDVFRSWMRPLRISVCVSAMVMIGAVVGLVTQLPRLAGPIEEHFSSSAYPVAAVTYLQTHHLEQGLLNAYNWGGYLIYRGVPTFVDGRTDIFLNQNVFADYLALQNVWWNCPDLVSQYKFKAALLPSGYALTTYLESQPGWHIAYSDNVAVVLVHSGSNN